MNYRHAFHAGNFADVMKHLVLMRILAYLALKPAPFRVIDSHAGAGLYDLRSREAIRGGEWQDGIGRLTDYAPTPDVAAILTPYQAALDALTRGGTHYPGSPLLIRHGLRNQDRAAFNELHPESYHHLRRVTPKDDRLTFTTLDGYTAWKAQIPPPERRGLVLVDPPFEETDEFIRLTTGMGEMLRKWPTGIAMLWYPVKDREKTRAFEAALVAQNPAKLLILELHIADIPSDGALAASGLAILNPPYTLAEEMRIALPALARLLARGEGAGFRIEMLVGA
jgi:23S rRNA (adenine2030-N6)-methyltransferase